MALWVMRKLSFIDTLGLSFPCAHCAVYFQIFFPFVMQDCERFTVASSLSDGLQERGSQSMRSILSASGLLSSLHGTGFLSVGNRGLSLLMLFRFSMA